MNHAHEALKRKLMEMHAKGMKSDVMPDSKGAKDEHMAHQEDMGDEVAGAAPSLDAYKQAKKLGSEPALEMGIGAGEEHNLAHPEDAEEKHAGDEYGSDEEESEEEKIDPGIHEKVLHALKSKGHSLLSQKAAEHYSKKMKMKKG